MKIKLLIVLFIIVCLIVGLIVCFYNLSTEKYIAKELGIDISCCKIEDKNDSHGGFLGDGDTMIKINCKENKKYILEQLENWKSLPLTENLELIMYGGEKDGVIYGYELAKKSDIPKITNGYYYFIDRHSESKDIRSDKHLFERNSFNFTLTLYDNDTDLMYYYEFDT